jgi:hypothetical protein
MISVSKTEELIKMDKDLFDVKDFWKGVIGDCFDFCFNNKEVISILADNEVIGAVRKYPSEAVKGVAYWLFCTAYNWRDKDRVFKTARILALDEVVNTVKKYHGETAEEIASQLARTACYFGDKDIVVKMAETVRKYDDGEVATKVCQELVLVAYYFKDINKVRRIIKMLEKVGKGMFDVLEKSEIYEIINENLDRIVYDRLSFDAVSVYIKSNKRLPKPDESNIKYYNKIALEYIKSKYGLTKDININQMLMLLSLDKRILIDKKIINEIIDLVNKSEEKNVKIYSLEAENSNSLNYSRDKLMEYSIISIIGSRDKDKEKQAVNAISEIVGLKIINKARNEFYSKYKHLMKEIIPAFAQGNYEKACDILKKTENEAIIDVINAANYKDVDISSARFIKAVESKNPLDYDNRVQMACVYLPNGASCEDILEYCRDDRFVLVRYDIGNQTLGSAICYMENGIFLVDSVEGHRRFRKPKIFEIVYNDLIERAKERGASMVVFNKNALNKTPTEFIDYLKTKNLPEETVNMELDTEGYLEADEDGVNGYIVKI